MATRQHRQQAAIFPRTPLTRHGLHCRMILLSISPACNAISCTESRRSPRTTTASQSIRTFERMNARVWKQHYVRGHERRKTFSERESLPISAWYIRVRARLRQEKVALIHTKRQLKKWALCLRAFRCYFNEATGSQDACAKSMRMSLQRTSASFRRLCDAKSHAVNKSIRRSMVLSSRRILT